MNDQKKKAFYEKSEDLDLSKVDEVFYAGWHAALKHAEKDCSYRWQLGIKNTMQQWEGNEQVIQALREAAAEIRRLGGNQK